MARHSGSAENRDHRVTSTSRLSQREQTLLPPISQVCCSTSLIDEVMKLISRKAIPEIGWTHPAHANIADYRRRLDHNPQGPTPYHNSRSLAPPSGLPSKSASRPTLEVPAPQPRSRHETPSSSSTRSMPIHSGPPHRKSGSSSSSDFSSNRRTSNTSPSISPHESSGHRLPPRKPSLERLKLDEAKPRRPQNDHTSLSRSPCEYGSAPAPLSQWSGYGHQPVQPLYAPHPRYQAGSPAVIPHPGYQVAPSPYAAYPGPQPDMKAYMMTTGQQQYAAAYPSMDGDEPRSKKRRGNLPKWQTDLMRSWYDAHIRNPYPTESEKHQMVRNTGLTLEQVNPERCPLISESSLTRCIRFPTGLSTAGGDTGLSSARTLKQSRC